MSFIDTSNDTGFEEVLEQLPEIVFCLDRSGNITYINRKGLTESGYRRDEIIGMHCTALIDPAEQKEGARSVASFMETIHTSIRTWTIRTKEKKTFPARISSATLMKDGIITGMIGVVTNVASQLALEKQLISSEERMRRLIDIALEGIVFHENGTITDCNRTFCELSGYEKDELKGIKLTSFFSSECSDGSETFDHRDEERYPCETILTRRDSSSIEVAYTAKTIQHSGDILSIVVIQDISHRKKFEYLHDHDELTGVLNTWGITNTLRSEIDTARLRSHKLAIMTIRFHHENYTLIREVDTDLETVILKSIPIEVAERLKTVLFKDDNIGRTADNEFVTLHRLHESLDITSSVKLIQKVLDIFKDKYANGVTLNANVGVTFFPDDLSESNPQKIISNSRYACEEAQLHRTEYVFYDEKSHKATREKMEFVRDLIIAVKQEECENFVLYYQPKVNSSCRITGMEALIRWKNPRWGLPSTGLVPPDRFIHTAEEIGLIGEIGCWVIRKACEQTRQWHLKSSEYADLQVAVNVSPTQLTEEFLDYIIRTIEEFGLAPEFLEIEITERESIKEKNSGILEMIQKNNISIAIDDFGIEYSSLSSLPKLSINTIKLDKSYIDNISIDTDYEHLVDSTIKMVHGFNYIVVAEGVENKEQADMLFKYMNCDKIQGYYFFKPMPPDEFEKALEKNLLKPVRP